MTYAKTIDRIVRNLTVDELVSLLSAINAYDRTFEESEYYPMDELDKLIHGEKPLRPYTRLIIDLKDVDETQGYFKYSACGKFVSADREDVIEEAEALIDDIIAHLVTIYNQNQGQTGFEALDKIANAARLNEPMEQAG